MPGQCASPHVRKSWLGMCEPCTDMGVLQFKSLFSLSLHILTCIPSHRLHPHPLPVPQDTELISNTNWESIF